MFAGNFFSNGSLFAKFAKIFFRKNFPLYNTYTHPPTCMHTMQSCTHPNHATLVAINPKRAKVIYRYPLPLAPRQPLHILHLLGNQADLYLFYNPLASLAPPFHT